MHINLNTQCDFEPKIRALEARHASWVPLNVATNYRIEIKRGHDDLPSFVLVSWSRLMARVKGDIFLVTYWCMR